jgi:hypothetical protein
MMVFILAGCLRCAEGGEWPRSLVCPVKRYWWQTPDDFPDRCHGVGVGDWGAVLPGWPHWPRPRMPPTPRIPPNPPRIPPTVLLVYYIADKDLMKNRSRI